MAKSFNGATKGSNKSATGGTPGKGAFTAKDCGLGSKPNGTGFTRPWTSVGKGASADAKLYTGTSTADRDGNQMSNANHQFPEGMKPLSTKHIPMPQGRMSTKQNVVNGGETKGMINPEGRIGVNRPNAGTFDHGAARFEVGGIGNGPKKG